VRRPLAVLALTASLTACRPTPASLTPTGVTRAATIQVTCDDHSITFSVTPWAVHLAYGDSIGWNVAGGSNTQEVTIDKVGREWAFNDAPPFHAMPNRPARAGRMKAGIPHGTRYSYSVEADCQNGTGPKIHGKIDPDMIVD
jgi:hypothetical protein